MTANRVFMGFHSRKGPVCSQAIAFDNPAGYDRVRKDVITMLNLLWLELKKIRRPVLATLLSGTVLTCILVGTLYQGYSIRFAIDAWEIGTEYIGLVFPLLVTVPVCWQLYYERRDHFLACTLSRISKRPYLLTKWTACAVSAFLILFVPYVISALCALYVNGAYDLKPSPEGYVHVFHTLYTTAPLTYALLLSLWKSLLGIFIMTFGFVLALYSTNLFVILTAPFVYSVLENFGWSILGMPQYRFITAFEPSSLSAAVITGASFLVGPLLLCAVIGVVVLYYTKVKHRTVYGM